MGVDAMPSDAAIREFGPWSPGISSRLPREYLPMSTMFRPENVSTSLDKARELSDICGLAPHELVAFRAERLLVHELLICVTADLTFRTGPTTKSSGSAFVKSRRIFCPVILRPMSRRSAGCTTN